MLKRSRNWLVLTILPGLFGFGRLVEAWTWYALLVFWICMGFCLFSLLLSLFEDAAEPGSRRAASAPEPSQLPVPLWARLSQKRS